MRPHSPAGVLYAEDFDAPEPIAEAPKPPPAPPVVVEPTFSLADLRRAAERAQEEGRTLARHEAEHQANARRTDALCAVAASLRAAQDELGAVALRAASATADTLLATVAALLPAFVQSQARGEAAALLRLLLPAMAHEPSLTIRLHPSLIEDLRRDLAPLLEDGGASVSWVGAEAAAPGDVSVRWNGGAMVRDTAALCAEIAALIAPPQTVSETTPDTGQESHDGQ